ncbi:uncharacterized protein LOC112588331 [Harpegnathos saltator]|uniref:uncharacterized protein LOC112588331 n=1 Tax=Harpegnathos saltator TaxID=610380 RepID=UPI000DBEDD67|nr:uncharacterized protein LOC112588331 [Harpegnathos saltator]
MTGCLREGVFPPEWRRAKLALFPKEGKEPGSASAYRPICLLGEWVRDLTRAVVEIRGGVLLTMSLDISNAFNTLPWPEIGRALEHFEVPAYLRWIISAYFGDRDLAFTKEGGVLGWRTMERDDTLVAGGRGWEEARLRVEAALESVVGIIKGLGLKVALQKTEAMYFHAPRRGAPPESRLLVDRIRVRVGPTIKYLGLRLDGRWNFEAHFRSLAPRVCKAGLALVSLMRIQGGPGWHARRLYIGVVLWIALYGATKWTPRLMATARNKSRLQQAMRSVVVKANRGVMELREEG